MNGPGKMTLRRRTLLLGASASALLPALPAPAETGSATRAVGPKILRYAFEIAETTMDPVHCQDLYSRTLTPHIYEGLYHYDHLARPIRIKPLTADGMPEPADDFKVWTVKVRPGIFFAGDPAFKGRRRELVAQDYVYSFKRFADPANQSPAWTSLESDVGMVGLSELRAEVLASKKPFSYDREIQGVRALDRFTLRFTLKASRPRFIETIAGGDLYGAVAREVVEFYGDQLEGHPVGTGPFRLAQWRRSSFIALERNPDHRERFYEDEVQPAADDAEGQALLARFRGRRLPMVDRVEVSIIEEDQPRWLSFVNGEADLAHGIGFEYASLAMPNGRVAPNLSKRGIRGYQIAEPAANYYIFNMEDATVGGYSAERIALRRAIGLGVDVQSIIDYVYSGLATPAQSSTLPHTSAYDPALKTEMSDHDPARANALLDLYGYRDRDGDGWRERPDGSPLLLKINTQSDQRSRKSMEVMSKSMKAIGIRVDGVVAQWPENLKAARAGNLQMWSVGLYASQPDSEGAFARFDSAQIGGQNMARIRLPALDALHDRVQHLPDGPERLAAFREMEKIAIAYMPYKNTVGRLALDMSHPQLLGYRRTVFWLDWWQFVDIDDSLRLAR
jgi:ABC-type transport system substrate-binding protein